MRILFINTFYYPNMQGGAEQSVKLLAESLVERGHEVAVYCVDSKDGSVNKRVNNGVNVYRYTANKFNLYRFSYDKKNIRLYEKVLQKLLCYYNAKCIKDFEKVCVDFQPDIIHTNTLYGISQVLWKKAYELGIPVVHTVRDISIVSPVQYGHKVNGIIKLLHQIYMRYFTKYISAVTAPSEYTLNSSLDIGCFSNALIKKCIVNSIEIHEENLLNSIKEKMNRTSPIIKFMYAGRLVYFKGIEHMLNAFQNINYKNCELHICGDGEMKSFVEERAAQDNRIHYHGKLNNKDLADVYEECDVLIVPSVWPEPFGRVIIEGNLHGLIVIAGDCGGMPEIINCLHGGILYQPGNEKELIECMEQLMERKRYNAFYEGIIKNIDIYNISHQIEAFENIYRQLCKS